MRLAGLGPALRDVVLPFVTTRVALSVVALIAWYAGGVGVPCDPCVLSANPLLDAWSRWDGGAYLSIARDGYSYEPGMQSNVAFSPLYPLLMRIGGVLLPGGGDDAFLAAGIVVSNLALLAAMAYLVALVRPELGRPTAARSVLYVLVFPTSFFLSAVYAESLFLALAIASVFYARRRRWVLSGTLAALAALARPFGVLLVLPLAVEFFAARRAAGGASRGGALALALPPLAFLGWQAYLYRLSGDPLLTLSAHAAYRRRPAAPWDAVLELFDPARYGNPWFVLGVLVLMTALVAVSWRVLRPSVALYGTSLLVATSASGTLASSMRYALVLFPAFIVLALAGSRPAVHLSYLAIAALLSALFMAMFAQWYWVG